MIGPHWPTVTVTPRLKQRQQLSIILLCWLILMFVYPKFLLVLCSFPGPVDTIPIHLSQTISEPGIHRKLCDSRAYWTTGVASGTRVGDKVVEKTRCSSGCSGTHSGVYPSHLTSSPSWDLPTVLSIGLELTCPNMGLEKSQSLHESVVELQEPRSRLVAASKKGSVLGCWLRQVAMLYWDNTSVCFSSH